MVIKLAQLCRFDTSHTQNSIGMRDDANSNTICKHSKVKHIQGVKASKNFFYLTPFFLALVLVRSPPGQKEFFSLEYNE